MGERTEFRKYQKIKLIPLWEASAQIKYNFQSNFGFHSVEDVSWCGTGKIMYYGMTANTEEGKNKTKHNFCAGSSIKI